MAVEKFNEKNIAIFSAIESTTGTYNAPAATDATPANSLTGGITYDTTAYAFIGDMLSRDEYTVQKDSYGDISVETLQQALNTSVTPDSVTAPLAEFMRACGGKPTIIGTGSTSSVQYDNATVENSTISVDYRKSSYDNTSVQKTYRFYGCRGQVDVNASLGDIPKLKFSLKGNAYTPVEAAVITPDYGTQTANLASLVRKSTIVTAQIASLSDTFSTASATAAAASGNIITLTTAAGTLTAFGAVGDIRAITVSGLTATTGSPNGTFLAEVVSDTSIKYTAPGAALTGLSGSPTLTKGTPAKTICFATLTANNFFGFDFARYLTGCEEGFSKSAVPTDVAVTILEDKGTIHSNGIAFAAVTAAASGVVTVPYASYAVGDLITITGCATDAFNVQQAAITAVSNAGAANAAYTYALKGGSQTLSAVTATNYTTEVAFASTSIFDPYANLNKYFGVKLKFGTATTKYVTYKWDKLQLTNTKEGKVGTYFGMDLSFRNIGRSYIVLEQS